MVMWPDELRKHAPSVASKLARALATAYWRARDIQPDHIAALLRRDETSEEEPEGATCYVSRRDFGDDLPCNADTGRSNTVANARYAASNAIRVNRPILRWVDDSWQVIGQQEHYTYHPAVFLHGNPRVSELVAREIRYINGYPALPFYFNEYQIVVPCAYYPPDENDMIDSALGDILIARIRSRSNPAQVYDLGPYANQPVDIDMTGFPIPWWDRVFERDIDYVYYYWLHTIDDRPRWVRIWTYPDVLQRPDVAPFVTVPQVSEGYAEIDLQVGIGVPEPLPAVPIPQTAGAVRIRALGANLYAVGHNGNWYIRAEGNLTYEMALKKWGLGVEGSTSRYIEMWGTQNGVDYVKIAEYNEADLVAGPVTITLPEGERVMFRWVSPEPFPVLQAAQLVLQAVIPGP